MSTIENERVAPVWAPPTLPILWSPSAIAGLTAEGELAAACRYLFEIGYNEHFFGHITWEQPDGAYLTNAYEVMWDRMTASDVLRVDDVGHKVDGHPLSPSSGLNLHTSLRHHVQRSETACIIHAHPEYGTMWAVRGEAPPIYDQGSAWLPDDVHVTADPAEFWLNELDAQAIGRCGWGLMVRHGAISVATSMHEAIFRLAILEHRSKRAWMLEGRGATPMEPALAAIFPGVTFTNYAAAYWNAELRRQVSLDPTVLD
ncbi:MAG: class II aldolase/adducin family protein [Acidimicrobiia bacterium]